MIDAILQLYAEQFSKRGLSRLNDFLLAAALRARGYNNFINGSQTGEDFFISQILARANPRICVDIGANVGSYTRKLLERTEATVVSFEPLPVCIPKLLENTKGFRARSIVENKGVGERNARLPIHYSPDAPQHASFSEEVGKVPYVCNQQQVEVEVISLDTYWESSTFDSVDFIKVDTEGFEAEVFKGAERTIKRFKPKYIQMEFNWHQMFRNTSLNYFAELLSGYDVYQLVPNGWVKRDPRNPLSNIFLFSNFVFVRQ